MCRIRILPWQIQTQLEYGHRQALTAKIWVRGWSIHFDVLKAYVKSVSGKCCGHIATGPLMLFTERGTKNSLRPLHHFHKCGCIYPVSATRTTVSNRNEVNVFRSLHALHAKTWTKIGKKWRKFLTRLSIDCVLKNSQVASSYMRHIHIINRNFWANVDWWLFS